MLEKQVTLEGFGNLKRDPQATCSNCPFWYRTTAEKRGSILVAKGHCRSTIAMSDEELLVTDDFFWCGSHPNLLIPEVNQTIEEVQEEIQEEIQDVLQYDQYLRKTQEKIMELQGFLKKSWSGYSTEDMKAALIEAHRYSAEIHEEVSSMFLLVAKWAEEEA